MDVAELRRQPLFAAVEESLLAEVLAAGEWVTAERGETVYSPHHFRRSLALLLQGRIQVRRESLLVSTLGEGDLFGAAALFTGKEDYPTTLVALTHCRLLFISQEGVRQLIRRSGDFAEAYVTYLSGRIQFLSDRLNTVSAGGGEGKLAQYLLCAGGEAGEITLSATQLCQRIGVGRATLYRAFETLEQAGAIRRQGKTIGITDRDKLRAYSNPS